MSLFARFTDPLVFGAERARNKPFLDAAMACAALAACAKGDIGLAKRHALDRVLESIDALKVFDVHVAVNRFTDFAQEIQTQPEHGRARALRAVAALADDKDSANALLRVGRAIAGADGQLLAPEIAQLEKIAAALGLPPPDIDEPALAPAEPKPSAGAVIVLGNQKGGTGKSTTAMHLAVALLQRGHKVGSIDLDGRQGTLSHYVGNRGRYAKKSGRPIAMPLHRRIEPVEAKDRDEGQEAEKSRLNAAFTEMADCRYVVVDTPGNVSHLSKLGHGQADTLITPLNDSFLDIDALAEIDREKRAVLAPSAYSKMVWQENERRAAGGEKPLDWIVMRNRLGQLDTRNNREMAGLLQQLSQRMSFRLEPGLSERVVFPELFFSGLTLLDLPEMSPGDKLNPSRLHARQEMHDLLGALGVPDLAVKAESAA
jgi:chromosome partitioning protein